MAAEPFTLGVIVAMLRDNVPLLNRRVGGTATLSVQAHDDVDIPVPHAFVVPLDDTGGKRADLNEAQLVTERFAVIVAVDNTQNRKDGLGLMAADELRVIRQELFNALLGFEVAGWYDTVAYVGSRHLLMSPARLYHQFEFSVKYYIAPAGMGERGPRSTDASDYAPGTEGNPTPPTPAQDAIKEVYVKRGVRDPDKLNRPTPVEVEPTTAPSAETLAQDPERLL